MSKQDDMRRQRDARQPSVMYDDGGGADFLDDLLSSATDNSGLLRDKQRLEEEKALLEEELAEARKQIGEALVSTGSGTFQFKRFQVSRVGLTIPDDANDDELYEIGRVLTNIDASITWALGDWAAFLYKKRGISYQSIAEEFGYEVETLYSYVSVCDAINTLIRNQGLSFGHHRLVARMKPKDQRRWLDQAIDNGWKVADMRAAIRKAEKQDIPRPALSRQISRYQRVLGKNRAEITALRGELQENGEIADKDAFNKMLAEEITALQQLWLDE